MISVVPLGCSAICIPETFEEGDEGSELLRGRDESLDQEEKVPLDPAASTSKEPSTTNQLQYPERRYCRLYSKPDGLVARGYAARTSAPHTRHTQKKSGHKRPSEIEKAGISTAGPRGDGLLVWHRIGSAMVEICIRNRHCPGREPTARQRRAYGHCRQGARLAIASCAGDWPSCRPVLVRRSPHRTSGHYNYAAVPRQYTRLAVLGQVGRCWY